MKIQITASGIYGAEGKEIPVGTEIEVKDEPTGWAGRYTVINEGRGGKTPVTGQKPAEDGAKAELEAKTVDELKAVAEAEKVDLKGVTAKGDIVAAILTARTTA